MTAVDSDLNPPDLHYCPINWVNNALMLYFNDYYKQTITAIVPVKANIMRFAIFIQVRYHTAISNKV